MITSPACFDILSGRRRGAAAGLARAGLASASMIYRAGVAARNAWFDVVRRASVRVDVPVISIGNITTGGSGKTPMAALVAARLAQRGCRVGILMRGYMRRRGAPEGPRRSDAAAVPISDEAEVLRRLCPGARVVIDADRVAGARRARAEGGDVLVMDDGFQHRRLRRDLDIVLVDATNPLGYGHMLPRGLLREPPRAMRRADVIVITRSDALSADECDELAGQLSTWSRGRPILRARHEVTGWVDVQGRRLDQVDAAAMRALIFAGIANFAGFVTTVERMGVEALAAYEFPDHHAYTAGEIEELAETARALEANAVLTTEKDAVKLIGRWPEDAATALMTPRVEMAMSAADSATLDAALTAALQRKSERAED